MSNDPNLASQLLAIRQGGDEKDNISSANLEADGGTDDKSKMTSSYRDFSRVLPEKHNDASSLIAQSTTAKEPTFPVKLHMILSNPEFQDIIAWLPHGRSWRILQQKAFEERVIPLYFRHGRYSSFARQVNGWGFKRITHGSDYNSYYHELFLRGMPHLCDKMRRLTTKDLSKKKKMEDGPTPDFYALSRDNPLPESTPVPTTTLTPPAIAAAGRGGADLANADVELALLERRRADIFNRMNLLASSNGMGQPGAFGGGGGAGGLQGQQFGQQFVGQQLGMGQQFVGQQDQLQMNNNSLVAAAALSLGNNGRPNGLNPASLQQQGFLGGMGGVPGVGGVSNVGQIFDSSNSALQRQLLEARLANTDMAAILGFQQGNVQNNGINGIPGLMMPPSL
ncbi:shock factor protein 4 [Seminavis robusta]|uniref:Shock factor protein 4 n=1 Tax=Seminavis robusta TaxID=568900 RepID=A0A9N8HB37_9STRA|nr:shock factor protein 4 [Seminavis robusta]|eukprot:Sro168_g074930.1 shock factor protein 4 (395) ;mRNA; r:92837-94441